MAGLHGTDELDEVRRRDRAHDAELETGLLSKSRHSDTDAEAPSAGHMLRKTTLLIMPFLVTLAWRTNAQS